MESLGGSSSQTHREGGWGLLLYCSCLDLVLQGIQPTMSSEPLPTSSCPPLLPPFSPFLSLNSAAFFSFLLGLSVHTCRCLGFTCACVLCVHPCMHVDWCTCTHGASACKCAYVLCVHMQIDQCACMHAVMHGTLGAHMHAFSVNTSLVHVLPCASVQVCAC